LTVPLPDRPSGLAISDDGRHLYITHLLSNRITRLVVPSSRVYLPFVVRSDRAEKRSFTVFQRTVSYGRAHTSIIPLWPDSNLVQSIVIAPNGDRAYVPHTRSNSSNRALTLDTTVFPIVSTMDLTTGQHLVGQQFNLDVLDPPAVGLPFDAAFTPDGAELWVLNAASNDVTVIDLETRQREAHIEVGDNPRGIVINPDGSVAYINNTLAGSVFVIDTGTYTVTDTIPVTSIPLDPVLLTGKRLFHTSDDPRMGKDQWMSCNTCHFDGENDGQTWRLGFAGPRNTSSLLGMGNTRPLRWSGEWDEAADSEFAIRMDGFGTGLVEGEIHCSLDPPDCVNHPPHAGVSPDLDALAAYISSLTVPLSPGHTEGQPLSEAA
jgi:YVTN family beta-propeller protein